MTQRLAGTYSADRVQVSIGLLATLGQAVDLTLPNGLSIPHVIDGYGTDAFLTVAREVATNSKTTGSDGEVVVQESRNASGMFSVTLMASSVSNTVLSSMLTLWESGAKFMFPMLVIDLDSFGTLYEADECWIQGWPEAGFGATLGTLTWNIEAAKLRMFHGSRGLVG